MAPGTATLLMVMPSVTRSVSGGPRIEGVAVSTASPCSGGTSAGAQAGTGKIPKGPRAPAGVMLVTKPSASQPNSVPVDGSHSMSVSGPGESVGNGGTAMGGMAQPGPGMKVAITNTPSVIHSRPAAELQPRPVSRPSGGGVGKLLAGRPGGVYQPETV